MAFMPYMAYIAYNVYDVCNVYDVRDVCIFAIPMAQGLPFVFLALGHLAAPMGRG